MPTASEEIAVFALAAEPSVPRLLWAGTESGVLRSDDGGERWAKVGDLAAVTALAISPGEAGSRIYAGGVDGLEVSDDAGRSWHPEGTGLQGGILALTADQTDDLVVGTTQGIYAREGDGGPFGPVRGLPKGPSRGAARAADGAPVAAVIHQLYRRTNGWTKLASLPLATSGDLPTISALLPLADGRVLVGTERGLHSSDGWKLVPPFDELAHLEIGALAVDPTRPHRIYLGASSIPNAVALARVGLQFSTAAVNDAPDPRLEVALAVVFLIGGVLAVRYLGRPAPAASL